MAATLALQFAGYLAVLVVLRALRAAGAFRRAARRAAGVGAARHRRHRDSRCFFAALQVFIRDVEHVLMPLLMILMYLTPILYPLTRCRRRAACVAANPFGCLVGRLRAALLEGDSRSRSAIAARRRRCAALLRRALGVPPAVADFEDFL